MPSSGETTMKSAVFEERPRRAIRSPAFETAAPASPPSSACDDDVGKPQPPGEQVPDDGADQRGADQRRA